jgi:hypothetical protein
MNGILEQVEKRSAQEFYADEQTEEGYAVLTTHWNSAAMKLGIADLLGLKMKMDEKCGSKFIEEIRDSLCMPVIVSTANPNLIPDLEVDVLNCRMVMDDALKGRKPQVNKAFKEGHCFRNQPLFPKGVSPLPYSDLPDKGKTADYCRFGSGHSGQF